MAYLQFKTNGLGIEDVNLFPTLPEWAVEGENGGDLGYFIEYDFDPSTEFISSLTLSEDKSSVVSRYPGQTPDEQRASYSADLTAAVAVVHQKATIRSRIKSLVLDIIEPVDALEEKAKELDEINGNTNNMRKIAIYREAARAANNTQEDLLDACTTLEELEEFNRDWTEEFKSLNPIPEIS